MHSNARKDRVNFYIAVSLFIGFCVCAVVVLFLPVEYDGAFNTQAAINFIQSGKVVLDYGPNWRLQTHLPFQFLSGIVLTVFGASFSSIHLASAVFVLLLGIFCGLLCHECKQPHPSFAYSALVTSIAFVSFGFSGYGELPVVVFLSFSLYLLLFRNPTPVVTACAGALLGLGLMTKWTAFLFLPSLLIVLFLLWVHEKRRQIVFYLIAAFVVFVLVFWLQFRHYSSYELQKLFGKVLAQTIPRDGAEWRPIESTQTYLNRVQVYWMMFRRASLPVIAHIKIILLLSMTMLASVHVWRKKTRLSQVESLFLFFITSAAIFYVFYFFFAAQNFARRYFIGDICLYLGAGIGFSLLKQTGYRKAARIGTYIFLLFSVAHIAYNTKELAADIACGNACREQTYKAALADLPENYAPYGVSVWEAPGWSFLAKKQFRNILEEPVLFDCLAGNCVAFLFLDGMRHIDRKMFAMVEELYELETVFTDQTHEIRRILGFNSSAAAYQQKVKIVDKLDATLGFLAWPGNSINTIFDSPRRVYRSEYAVFIENSSARKFLELHFKDLSSSCSNSILLKITSREQADGALFSIEPKSGQDQYSLPIPPEASKYLDIVVSGSKADFDRHSNGECDLEIGLPLQKIQTTLKPRGELIRPTPRRN